MQSLLVQPKRFGAREEFPTSALQKLTQNSSNEQRMHGRVVTMKHHHARGREETVFDLPSLVSTRSACRRSSTCVREAGMSDRASAEDTSQLATPEPRLRHRVAD